MIICKKVKGKKKCKKIDCRLKRNRKKKVCISNTKYIHGDFDMDGTPNIDDKYPLNKFRKGQVNKELKLSDTIRYLKVKRKDARELVKKFAKETGATGFRVKGVYSTINKAVRRNPLISNDFIGLKYEKDVKKEEIKKKWDKFNKKYKIGKMKIAKKNGKVIAEFVGKEDKYKLNKGTPNNYRAYHSNFILGDYGAEYQFRTKRYGILNDLMHQAWKNKDFKSMEKFKKEARKLLKEGY